MRTRRIGASVPAALPEMGSEPMAPNLKQVAAPLGMFTPGYPRQRVSRAAGPSWPNDLSG